MSSKVLPGQAVPVSEKTCGTCKEVRPAAEFGRNGRRSDGLQDRCNPCRRAWRKANSAKCVANANRWRVENPERYAATRAIWLERTADRQREIARNAQRRYRKIPTKIVHIRMRARLKSLLVQGWGNRSTFEVLGYTRDELMAHLERQFLKGMSWENIGHWHIDHIVPLSSFAVSSMDSPEFRRAWSLTNLRPLWAKDNLKKGAQMVSLL